MSLFEELIEDREEDEKIVKSLKTKDELSSDIFDAVGGEYKMRPEIRNSLIVISDDFIETFGIDVFVHDVVLTGSLSNYNWSEYSDVDLHIMIDMSEFDGLKDGSGTILKTVFKELFDSKKSLWNKNRQVKVRGFDVEVYVQDTNEDHISSGVYSILHDKWVVTPEKTSPNIDDRVIIEKAEEFIRKIDELVDLNNNNQPIADELDELRTKLKKFRQSGLESGGEYSYENLAFKLLRRNGYIGKMISLKSKIINRKLSVTQ